MPQGNSNGTMIPRGVRLCLCAALPLASLLCLRYPDCARRRKQSRCGIARRRGESEGDEGAERSKPGDGAAAEPLHGGADDQRDSRGDRADGTGRRERRVCSGAGIPPGRDSDSDALAGSCGRGCEPAGVGMDLAFAGAAVGSVAAAGDEPEGTTLGVAAVCAGDSDTSSGGVGGVDPPDGSSQRACPGSGWANSQPFKEF